MGSMLGTYEVIALGRENSAQPLLIVTIRECPETVLFIESVSNTDKTN